MESNDKPDPMAVILSRDLARANREIEELRAEVRKLKGEDKIPVKIKF